MLRVDGFIKISKKNTEIRKQDILDKLDFLQDDIAFIAGSLIEEEVNPLSKGMGNRLSDIDCFILTDSIVDIGVNETGYSFGNRKTRFDRIMGINFDTEIYPKKAVLHYADQINNLKFDMEQRAYNWISNRDHSFSIWNLNSVIHRLLNSVPLYNQEGYRLLLDGLNKDNFFRFNVILAINEVEVRYDDIVGNLETSQFEVAVHSARDALNSAMKAYIFYRKTSFDRDRWIPLKLKNLAEADAQASEIYNEYRLLNFASPLSTDDEYRNNIKGIIKFINRVTNLLEG